MASLLKQYPDLQFSISANNQLLDLHSGEADIAIRYGNGDYPGLRADYFLGDAASILIATEQLYRYKERSNINILRDEILLEDASIRHEEPSMAWPQWLRDTGVERAPNRNRIRFSDSALAINACLSGAGICIGRISLVLEALRRRQVTALMPWRSTEFAYYIVYLASAEDDPRLRAFLDWLTPAGRHFASQAQSSAATQIRSA